MRSMRRIGTLCCVPLFMLAVAGCSLTRPPTAAPASVPAQWNTPLPRTLPHGGSEAALADWWRQMDDPLLVEIVEAAERASPNVASAAARVAEARATRIAAGAAMLPNLDGSLQASRSNTWNSLACASCHQSGPSGLPGTKPFAMPLVNAVNDYPKFDIKSGKTISLEQRVIGMFGPGAVPVKDTPELKAILAYIRWLARGTDKASAMALTGLQPMPAIDRAADPLRGAKLYAAQCAACHGADATGTRRSDFDAGGGYLFPPIAGPDTYGNAGHMFAVPLLARYIRASMPLGATHDKPLLTPDQALDIAAYLNDDAMPRPRTADRTPFYPDPAFRPQGWAIPENFKGKPADYLRAKNGPFRDVNEEY